MCIINVQTRSSTPGHRRGPGNVPHLAVRPPLSGIVTAPPPAQPQRQHLRQPPPAPATALPPQGIDQPDSTSAPPDAALQQKNRAVSAWLAVHHQIVSSAASAPGRTAACMPPPDRATALGSAPTLPVAAGLKHNAAEKTARAATLRGTGVNTRPPWASR